MDRTEPYVPSANVQLGEYIIEERIGSGGMGQVYKARQPSLDRLVALKVLPRGTAQSSEHVERFYREAKSAARLIHPNIVQIYTVGEDKGIPYFAMEYVVGEDLDKRLRRGEKFSIQETLGIVTSVAMALACAEEHGIVHRDIKPGNIMIDSHGVVKVTDFGLAKAAKVFDTEITQAGFIVGTPTYMAPEQAEGREVDARTDIYSLGVVFYELLCGRPPFKSDDPATLIYMHIHKAPDPPRSIRPEIPEEVERICLKCLAKRPEDRYQSSSELLKDLMHVRTTVKLPEEGTIVFDRHMAEMLASSTRRPKKTEEKVERPTEKTVSMAGKAVQAPPQQWFSAHWPILAGASSAAAIILTVALIYLLSGAPEPPAIPTVPQEQETTTTELAPRHPVLPLSRLRGFLPDGTELEVQIGNNPPYKVRSLEDQAVEAARVKVTARKPHYKEVSVEFDVSPGACTPEMSAELFRLEPDEELTRQIDKVRESIRNEDFLGASQALEAVRLADPSSNLLPELERALAESKASWNKRWVEVFRKAEGLLAEGKMEEADTLLGSIPPLHEHYDAARRLREGIAANKMKLLEGRAKVEGLIREGKFREARAAYDGLVNVLRLPTDALADLGEQLERAEALEKEAEELERSGAVESARARLLLLAKMAPSSGALLARIQKLEETIERLDRARKIIARIEEHLASKDFAKAAAELAELKRIDPKSERIAPLELRIKTESAEHELRNLLGLLDKGMISLDAGAVCALIDREKKELLDSCRNALESLRSHGAVLAHSKMKLRGVELGEDGVSADVAWEYGLELPSIRKRLSGSREMHMSFRRTPGGLRLAAVRDSQDVAKLDGGGPEDRRIKGKVVAVDRDVLTIDRGSSSGVKLRMVFGIYRDARVATLPLANAIVVIEEERIGEARVIDVRPNECLASFVPGALSARPSAGMLAVESPLSAMAAAPPAVVALKAERISARMGEAIGLEAVAQNPDGLPCFFLWEASGGKMSFARTSVPKVRWIAPARAGEYRAKVTLVSPLGSSVREVTLQSTGSTAPAKLAAAPELRLTAPFESAADIAFDEAGNACVLDGSGKLILFDSDMNMLSASTPYKGKAKRIALLRSNVYVLDVAACTVQRYPLAGGKDPFAGPPSVSYGRAGLGNGKLRRPVAFAITNDGCVGVLDAGTSTVQVFSPEGRFLSSMGLPGTAPGEMANPVAIASDVRGAFYVLDAERKQVLTFRGGRFDGEWSCGDTESDLADLAYDAIGDRLLVLDKKRQEVVAYTTGGSKHQVSIVPARLTPKPGEKPQEPAPGELSSPSRIVCDGMARLYVIGGARSQTIDRYLLPLPSETDRPARFTGQFSSVVPYNFARIAADADGTLYLLDPSSGTLWQMRGIWRTAALGGKSGPIPTWSTATAVACDGAGDFYVLEPSMCWIHRFSPQAQRIAHFGKKGSAEEASAIPDAIDIAGSLPSAARPPGTRPGELLAVLLRERRFGIHLFTPVGEALPPFPSRGEGSRPAQRIAICADGTICVALQGGTLETYSISGEPKSRFDSGVSDLSGMTASPDGRIYLLDAKRRTVACVSPQEGKVVAKFELPRILRAPSDLACDGCGMLYIIDARARTVYPFVPSP